LKKKTAPCIIVLFALALILPLILGLYSSKLLPSAAELAYIQAQNRSNIIIDNALKETSENLMLETKDFFTEQNGIITSDTMLINSFVAGLSTKITENFSSPDIKDINIPMGALTGADFLANTGPSIGFELLPAGFAEISPETQCLSIGINQTNYRIFINISINIRIVNPLLERSVTLNRRILLVDTVIMGEVPETYLKGNI